MATSIIKIYDTRSGRWSKNAKVVLGWDGFTNLGMSKPAYTDGNGVATVNHASTGRASVYINGREVGKMSTPGSATFEV